MSIETGEAMTPDEMTLFHAEGHQRVCPHCREISIAEQPNLDPKLRCPVGLELALELEKITRNQVEVSYSPLD